MAKPIEILVVEDHLVVRAGVRSVIEKNPELLVKGEAASGQEALQQVRDRAWDVVLLDLKLPDMDGFVVLDEIKRMRPDQSVLFFSSAAEEEFAMAAIDRGASGFLSKDSDGGDLRFAIQKVASGQQYIGPGLAKLLLGGGRGKLIRVLPHEQLSVREYEVMLRIAAGEQLTRVGVDLHISVKTVSTHRARILEKMGMTTNAELTRYAFSEGLLKG